MDPTNFPLTQGELVRQARAGMTKSAFAEVLGVHRSSLTRYESEELGAPPGVINHCLRAIAARYGAAEPALEPLQLALAHAREAVGLLERASAAGRE
jgi:transcriptional regulator with XRE-family HTH domain